jgi:osmoprotectant transport system ATP-binding protein
MIRMEKVTKRFGSTVAVDNFSIEINSGEVCVLIGPSGSGKTTLLKMINCLIEPTSGSIFIDGRETNRMKPETLRRSIGYAIQSVGLFPHMTVAENIAVVPQLLHWDKKRIAGRVKELIVLVGLDPEKMGRRYPRVLSGGEAQRIGVARALAADPPLLLMDEPFGAVDPLTREKLQTQFERIQKELKKTVMFVTHDLDEAIRLADRVAVMKAGKLVQFDTPEILLSKPANKFVNDFVGTDRALKRLSRINIQGLIKPGVSVSIEEPAEKALKVIGNRFSAWVINKEGQLLGWVDRSRLLDADSVSEATVYPDINEIAVTPDNTLRQALSIMLGQGVRSLPVIDNRKILIGEVSLSEVEAVTAEKESKYVQPKD